MSDARELLARDQARSARVMASGGPISTPKGKAGGVPFPFDRVDMLSANAREQINQPYKRSVWVMRAIKIISGPIAAVPINAFDAVTLSPIEDPALKAFLAAPIRGIDPDDFAEAAIGWLKLKGEVFLIADDSWLVPFQDVARRNPLRMPRPDQMRHLLGNNGELVGWEYRDPKQGNQVLLPEQVFHKKFWNPYDQWRGLGEWEAARIATESDFYAGEFARNLNANNGDQGQFVLAKNGYPTDEQREQIISALREKRMRAQRGEAVYTFLGSDGEMEVEAPKVNTVDANFVTSRLHNRHEIYIAFGVPASMADIQQSYSIGSASDRYRLIEETSMPNARKLAALLEGPASRIIGRPVMLQYDWDDHSTMQAARRERVASAVELWKSGWPWKKIEDFMHLGVTPFNGWDKAFVPLNVQEVDTQGLAPADDPALGEKPDETDDPADEEEQAVERMMRALRRGRPAPVARAVVRDEFSIFACTCHRGAGVTLERDPKRVERWQNHMRHRRETVKSFVSAIGRVLMAARVETLKKIEAHTSKSIEQRDGASAGLVFDLNRFSTAFGTAMDKQEKNGLQTAGDQLFDEIGLDDPYSMAPTKVLEFLRSRQNRLRDVPQEMFDELKASLEEGLQAGETTDQLAARAKDVFNSLADGRARRIALTETSAVYGAGRHDAMLQAGVTHKEWLTSGNANVRPAHAEAEGQTVPIDEPFIVDGEALMFPGDSSGSPENVINCHCVQIAKQDE